jgi:hypothetical protein
VNHSSNRFVVSGLAVRSCPVTGSFVAARTTHRTQVDPTLASTTFFRSIFWQSRLLVSGSTESLQWKPLRQKI